MKKLENTSKKYINEILSVSLNQAEIDAWWERPHSKFDGKTPTEEWEINSSLVMGAALNAQDDVLRFKIKEDKDKDKDKEKE